jgi:hypothetical protein
MQLDIWIPKYNLALEYQGELDPLSFCFSLSLLLWSLLWFLISFCCSLSLSLFGLCSGS